MAKLGFTKAGAAGFEGKVSGVIVGNTLADLKAEDAMKALAEGGRNLGQKLENIVFTPTKVEAPSTKPFAFENERFDAPISLKNAFERGFSPEATEVPKSKINLGFDLKPA